MTTTNLAEFGTRELEMVEKLLKAYREQGPPEQFSVEEVRPMLNVNSSFVFLTNTDFEVAMLNGDKLEMFYTTPYEGHEGFKDELLGLVESGDIDNVEDIEFIQGL